MITLNTTPNSIDQLGTLLAQIADLTKQADAIKDALKNEATANGSTEWEGSLFKSTYTEANRSVVDYKKLLAVLGATEEQITAHTKTTAVFSIRTTAR